MWNSGEVFVQRQGHIEAPEVGIHVYICKHTSHDLQVRDSGETLGLPRLW